MSDLTLPVFVGVLVFVISQYILKLILEPVIYYRKILSDISYTLLFNQSTIASGIAKDEILMRKIQELAAILHSSVYLIPYYKVIYSLRIFRLPLETNIILASQKLNILSYNVNVSKSKEGQYLESPSIIAQQNENILTEISALLSIKTTFKLPK